MMEGVRAMRGHRKGWVTLRPHRIVPLALPAIDEATIRSTREGVYMSRNAFAHRLPDQLTQRRIFSGEGVTDQLTDRHRHGA
jgi:hypothetical protein